MADVAGLFQPPPSGGAANVSRRQGTVRSFNQATLQNTVDVGGTVFTDLPILGVAEAATLAEGSVVCVDWTGTEYVILGRIVRPNTADATDAVNRLSGGTLSASVATSESTTNTTFTDLATVGPVVRPTVKSSGRLVVFISASILAIDDAPTLRGASMGIEVRDSAGSVVYAATSLPELRTEYTDNAVHTLGDSLSATRTALIEGLTPGLYTVTAKYHASTTGNTAAFAVRNLTTIAL